MAGVSIRTLHHYDEIGLLRPSGRSDSGYRLYAEGDIERLRRILFYRELDFGLEQIAEILATPEAAAEDHLRRQHRLLRHRRRRTEVLLSAIETEMEVRRMGMSLNPEEQLEVFGTDGARSGSRRPLPNGARPVPTASRRRRAAAYTNADWVEISARPARTSRASSRARGR